MFPFLKGSIDFVKAHFVPIANIPICSKNFSFHGYLMAQKIFPRSLRSPQWISQDFTFFSEKSYANVWAKGYEVAHAFLGFAQKNLLYKKKRKIRAGQRSHKRKKVPSFFPARFFLCQKAGIFQGSPLLFKFAHGSLSKKYNPIKNTFKVARSFPTKKKSLFLPRKSFKPFFPQKSLFTFDFVKVHFVPIDFVKAHFVPILKSENSLPLFILSIF